MLAVDCLLKLCDLPRHHGRISAFASHDSALFVGTTRGYVFKFIVENSLEETTCTTARTTPTSQLVSAMRTFGTEENGEATEGTSRARDSTSTGQTPSRQDTLHGKSNIDRRDGMENGGDDNHGNDGFVGNISRVAFSGATDEAPPTTASSSPPHHGQQVDQGKKQEQDKPRAFTTLLARVAVSSPHVRGVDSAVTQLQLSACCPLLFVLCDHWLTAWHAHTLQPLSVITYIPMTIFDVKCAAPSDVMQGNAAGVQRGNAPCEHVSSPERALALAKVVSAAQRRHIICAAEHQSRGLAVFELTVVVAAAHQSLERDNAQSAHPRAPARCRPERTHGACSSCKPSKNNGACVGANVHHVDENGDADSSHVSRGTCHSVSPYCPALRHVPRKAVLIQQLRLPEPVLAVTLMSESVACVGMQREYRWVNLHSGNTRRTLRRRGGSSSIRTATTDFTSSPSHSTRSMSSGTTRSTSAWSTRAPASLPRMAHGAQNSLYLCDGAALWVTCPRRGRCADSKVRAATAVVKEGNECGGDGVRIPTATRVGDSEIRDDSDVSGCDDSSSYESKDESTDSSDAETTEKDESLICWSPVRRVLLADDIIRHVLVHFPFVFVFTSGCGDVYSAYHSHTWHRCHSGRDLYRCDGRADDNDAERNVSDHHSPEHNRCNRGDKHGDTSRIVCQSGSDAPNRGHRAKERGRSPTSHAHWHHLDDASRARMRGRGGGMHGCAGKAVAALERLPLPGCCFATAAAATTRGTTKDTGRAVCPSCAALGGVFIASRRSVWLAQVHTLRHQLTDLVEQDCLAAAFALLRDADATPEMARELCIMAGFACLHRARMTEAMRYFAHHLDPRELLLHLPECIPAPVRSGAQSYWTQWHGACVYNCAVGRLDEMWERYRGKGCGRLLSPGEAANATHPDPPHDGRAERDDYDAADEKHTAAQTPEPASVATGRCRVDMWDAFKLALECYLSEQFEQQQQQQQQQQQHTPTEKASTAEAGPHGDVSSDCMPNSAYRDMHSRSIQTLIPVTSAAASSAPMALLSSRATPCDSLLPSPVVSWHANYSTSSCETHREGSRSSHSSGRYTVARADSAEMDQRRHNRQRVMGYALLVLALQRRDHRRVYALVRHVDALHAADAAPLLSALREYRLLALLLYVRHRPTAAARVLRQYVYLRSCPCHGTGQSHAPCCASHCVQKHAQQHDNGSDDVDHSHDLAGKNGIEKGAARIFGVSRMGREVHDLCDDSHRVTPDEHSTAGNAFSLLPAPIRRRVACTLLHVQARYPPPGATDDSALRTAGKGCESSSRQDARDVHRGDDAGCQDSLDPAVSSGVWVMRGTVERAGDAGNANALCDAGMYVRDGEDAQGSYRTAEEEGEDEHMWWRAVAAHYTRGAASVAAGRAARTRREPNEAGEQEYEQCVQEGGLAEAFYLIDAMDVAALHELLQQRRQPRTQDNGSDASPDLLVDVCVCDGEGNSLLHVVCSLLLRSRTAEEDCSTSTEHGQSRPRMTDQALSRERLKVVLLMLTLLVQAGAPTDKINVHGQSCVDVVAEAEGGRWLDVVVATLLAAVSLRSGCDAVPCKYLM